MKKIILFILIIPIFLVSCSKDTKEDSIENIVYSIDYTNSYYILDKVNVLNNDTLIIDESYNNIQVKVIEGLAFSGLSNLKEITLPKSIERIGSNAFYNCKNLSYVDINCNITSINYGTFYNCESLKSIDIPSEVKRIGDCAFRNCYSLENLVLPENLVSIGEYSFDNCNNLKELILPISVKTIENCAFRNCNNLNIYYMGSSEEYSKISIKNNDNITLDIVYFYSEVEPEEVGNYWHYVDGMVTKW